MSKAGKSKRSAQRFALYVQAMGFVPLPFSHSDYRAYAVALQQQYQELRLRLGLKVSSEARIIARAMIRRKTLSIAAGDLVPPIAPPHSEFLTRYFPRTELLVEEPSRRVDVGLRLFSRRWAIRYPNAQSVGCDAVCPRNPGLVVRWLTSVGRGVQTLLRWRSIHARISRASGMSGTHNQPQDGNDHHNLSDWEPFLR
jgi:hypothetical protein